MSLRTRAKHQDENRKRTQPLLAARRLAANTFASRDSRACDFLTMAYERAHGFTSLSSTAGLLEQQEDGDGTLHGSVRVHTRRVGGIHEASSRPDSRRRGAGTESRMPVRGALLLVRRVRWLRHLGSA